jgi:hypothetical protein
MNVIKHVQPLTLLLTFSSSFPDFLTPQVSIYQNWTVEIVSRGYSRV